MSSRAVQAKSPRLQTYCRAPTVDQPTALRVQELRFEHGRNIPYVQSRNSHA
jgi:hypothetical protein